MMALEGIKVLDLSPNAAGQFGTMVLGDLGADVLKVERPMSGDRALYDKTLFGITGPEEERRQAAHSALGRNKRSIALNLKRPEAREIFYRLAEDADVVMEGFRPGVVKRLGVDYETIKEINPKVIYCSLSGYGQDGPYSGMVGHDINYISHAGVLGLIGNEEAGKPAVPLNLMADYAGGGLSCAVAILAAVVAREKTGRGQYLDIAMTEGVFYMMAGLLAGYLSGRAVPRRAGMLLNGGSPSYNVYETRDGKYISIAALEPWFWESLCRVLDREDLIPYQLAQGQKSREIGDFLSETFRSKSRDEWFELLKDRDISVGKVYTLDEVLEDPQLVGRGMVVDVETPEDGPIKQPGIAIHMSETPGKIRTTGPVTGQHTREILVGLGYTEEQIRSLQQQEAIQ